MVNAAMRATMTRIGFTVAGSQAIVNEQDISSLAEVQLLRDDEVESLCKVLRRPGGMVPGAGPGAAQVQNPGVQVNQCAEGHMELMAFYLCHQYRVSRTVISADITLDSIRTVRE
jgi:ribosomal protein S13